MDINTIATDRATVNAVIQANPGVLVLLHWYDIDEASNHAYDGTIKFKWPFELQCFAIGVLTGEPIYDEPWGERHTKWFLPVEKWMSSAITGKKLRFEKADRYPQNLGGTHPSLEPAENTGYDPEVSRSIKLHRRAQIIVGEDNIRTWLWSHEDFKSYAEQWFADIVCHNDKLAAA